LIFVCYLHAVDPQNLYGVFTPVARFAATVPFHRYQWNATVQSPQSDCQVMTLAGNSTAALLFVRNTNNTWWMHSHGVPLGWISAGSLRVRYSPLFVGAVAFFVSYLYLLA
jgi:hypothetical protein